MLGGKVTKPTSITTSNNNNFSYVPPVAKPLTTNNNYGSNINVQNQKKPFDNDFEDPLNEEVEDENSIQNGSYIGNKKSGSNTNQSQDQINETV